MYNDTEPLRRELLDEAYVGLAFTTADTVVDYIKANSN